MRQRIRLFLCGILWIPAVLFGQDIEESAEVFLEEYSDEFQELFFEALKQRGIENYDKAINLFLECKRLDADNPVLDHELAKIYAKVRQYPLAQEYAITAVTKSPDNRWYIQTLLMVLQFQGSSIDLVQQQIPYEYPGFREQLAQLYFEAGKLGKALKILKGIKKTEITELLRNKIEDALDERKRRSAAKEVIVKSTAEENPVETYKKRIEKLFAEGKYKEAVTVSEEALENYPLQAYFYYVHGHALQKDGQIKEGIAIMEAGLEYLLGNEDWSEKLYRALAECYTTLGNSTKANLYLSKIKSGS